MADHEQTVREGVVPGRARIQAQLTELIDRLKVERDAAVAERDRLREVEKTARALTTSRYAPTCVGLGIAERWAALYDALAALEPPA